MYKRRFYNPPDLIAAINSLGAGGLFDFLVPHRRDYVLTYGKEDFKAMRLAFLACAEPHFGDGLRTQNLCLAIENWREGGFPPDISIGYDRLDRFFKYMAGHVWMADNQPEEAIRQIKAGEFDDGSLRRKHIAVLWKDPDFVAGEFTNRILRSRALDNRVKKLVRLSLGRIALRESRRDIDWVRQQDGDRIDHIVDWLVSDVSADAPWLSNVDELGRPRKIMKMGSLDRLHAEAEKQMRRKLSSQRVRLRSEDECLFAGEQSSLHLVRLKTPEALDLESAAMRHCVGHGAFDGFLLQEGCMLLSLRDASNLPHATIQVCEDRIVQFRGKANTIPKDEYRAASERLLSPLGIAFPDPVPFLDNPCAEIVRGEAPALPPMTGLDVTLSTLAVRQHVIDQTQEIRLFG